MEELYSQLQRIDELLEQIGAITDNQTTVLLQEKAMDEENIIEVMEKMVDYKEELIDELKEIEDQFNRCYERNRERLTEKNDILRFKECVAKILEKKQRIQESEENNVRIMQMKEKHMAQRTEILRRPDEVVAAYKKQQGSVK